jgi:hypothetical protein
MNLNRRPRVVVALWVELVLATSLIRVLSVSGTSVLLGNLGMDKVASTGDDVADARS